MSPSDRRTSRWGLSSHKCCGWRHVKWLCVILSFAFLSSHAAAEEKLGTLEIRAVDENAGKPVAARMHLKDSRGKPVRAPGVPNWNDHFVFDGAITLKLSPGEYRYEVERGPEYHLESGRVTVTADKTARLDVKLRRLIEMKRRGWWSGDTHIHRPLRDVQLLMRAEDLHVGPVITWWNRRNLWAGRDLPEKLLESFDGDRFLRVMAGEDERGGGALMFYNLDEPLPITKAGREFPSPVKFLELAKQNAAVDVEKRFWWDAPTWVATGLVDSIGLANNHMQRDGMLDSEAWVRQRIARLQLANPAERREVVAPHEAALKYWQQPVDTANAD